MFVMVLTMVEIIPHVMAMTTVEKKVALVMDVVLKEPHQAVMEVPIIKKDFFFLDFFPKK